MIVNAETNSNARIQATPVHGGCPALPLISIIARNDTAIAAAAIRDYEL